MDKKEKIFQFLVPDSFKSFNDNNSDKIIENLKPNIINITGALLPEFFNKEIVTIGEYIETTKEQLKLSPVLELIPGVTPQNLSIEFLKSLLIFKGTNIDLEYILKLVGIEISIYEKDSSIIHYGDEKLLYGNTIVYGGTKLGEIVEECKIIIEAFINENYYDIIDITLLKNVLKQILENRLYFCIELQNIIISIRFKDFFIDEINEKITITKNINTRDCSIRRYFPDGKHETDILCENKAEYYGGGNKYGKNTFYGNVVPSLLHFKEDINVRKRFLISENVINNIDDKGQINIRREFQVSYGDGKVLYGSPNTYTPTNEEFQLHYGDNSPTIKRTITF